MICALPGLFLIAITMVLKVLILTPLRELLGALP
jgi:hypothetical protein